MLILFDCHLLCQEIIHTIWGWDVSTSWQHLHAPIEQQQTQAQIPTPNSMTANMIIMDPRPTLVLHSFTMETVGYTYVFKSLSK